MAIAKVIEVIAEGKTIEDAIAAAAVETGKSLRGVRSVYAENITALITDGKVSAYRVNAKVTFVVE